MSTGILLLSHTGIATSLLKVATQIWHTKPDNIDTLEVEFDADTQALSRLICNKTQELDQGNGVLIMTDLVGATPCNLASEFCSEKLLLITGLNLPMLLRTYNYIDRPLTELGDIALQGGQRGISLVADNKIKGEEPVLD